MPLRLLAAASRLADAPGAEVVVYGSADLSDQCVTEGNRAPFHTRSEHPGRYLRVDGRDASAPRLAADADGVLLEDFDAPWEIERLGARLAVAEAEAGLPDGSLRIVPVVGTARGVLSLASFRPLPRLAGIACDPDRLAARLGCGPDAPAIVQVRALTVLAAAACGVPAILVVREPGTGAEREGFGAILLDDRR